MGASLVGSGLVSTTPCGSGVHAMSLKSGSIIGGMGVGSTGTVVVAASLFGRVMVGSVDVQMSCKGVVGQKSLVLVMGPIHSLMSISQLDVEFVA